MLVNHHIPDSVKNDIHTEYVRQRQAYAEIAEKANVGVDVIEIHFLEMTTARVTFFRQKRKSKPSLFNFYQKKQRTLGDDIIFEHQDPTKVGKKKSGTEYKQEYACLVAEEKKPDEEKDPAIIQQLNQLKDEFKVENRQVAESQRNIVLANGTATIEKIMDVMYHEYGTESILVGTTPIGTGSSNMNLTSIGLSKGEHAKNLLKELKSRSNLLLNFENALIPEEYRRGPGSTPPNVQVNNTYRSSIRQWIRDIMDDLGLGGKNINWAKINKPGPGLKVRDWPEGVPLKPISQMSMSAAGNLEKYLKEGGRPVFYEALS